MVHPMLQPHSPVPTWLWAPLLLAAITAEHLRAQEAAAPDASTAGYYEGSVTYQAEFFTDRPLMGMYLRSNADYWFVVLPNGKIQGEGLATYQLEWALDWTVSVKQSMQLGKALGVNIDPDVAIVLDSETAAHSFTIGGTVNDSEGGSATADMDFQWADDGKLQLHVIGTLGGSAATTTASGFSMGLGLAKFGRVKVTIEQAAPLPFGTSEATLPLQKRSPLGPYAMPLQYEGQGGSEGTQLAISGTAVQKIDYGRIRWLAEVAKQVPDLEQQIERLTERLDRQQQEIEELIRQLE